MPFWCGAAGMGGGLWWIFPLFGLLFMVAVALACFRGFGCVGRGPRRSPDADLRREIEDLREQVRRHARNPG